MEIGSPGRFCYDLVQLLLDRGTLAYMHTRQCLNSEGYRRWCALSRDRDAMFCLGIEAVSSLHAQGLLRMAGQRKRRIWMPGLALGRDAPRGDIFFANAFFPTLLLCSISCRMTLQEKNVFKGAEFRCATQPMPRGGMSELEEMLVKQVREITDLQQQRQDDLRS